MEESPICGTMEKKAIGETKLTHLVHIFELSAARLTVDPSSWETEVVTRMYEVVAVHKQSPALDPEGKGVGWEGWEELQGDRTTFLFLSTSFPSFKSILLPIMKGNRLVNFYIQ